MYRFTYNFKKKCVKNLILFEEINISWSNQIIEKIIKSVSKKVVKSSRMYIKTDIKYLRDTFSNLEFLLRLVFLYKQVQSKNYYLFWLLKLKTITIILFCFCIIFLLTCMQIFICLFSFTKNNLICICISFN